MRKSLFFKCQRLMRCAVAVALMCSALPLSAFEKTFEAVYTPDPSNPTKNTFQLLTPGEGHCSLPIYWAAAKTECNT